MKYVSPEYQQQLEDLAETLRADRYAKTLGQLALFETPDNVIHAEHRFQYPTVTEVPPPEVA